MPVFTYALPIKPGQAERVAKFAAELEGRGLRAEYDQLNAEGTIRQHMITIQPGPPMDLAIHTLVVEEMAKMGRMFTSGAYDTFWLDFLRDVHGIDVRMGQAPPNPQRVFDSAAQRPAAPAGPPPAGAPAPGAAPAGPPASAPAAAPAAPPAAPPAPVAAPAGPGAAPAAAAAQAGPAGSPPAAPPAGSPPAAPPAPAPAPAAGPSAAPSEGAPPPPPAPADTTS